MRNIELKFRCADLCAMRGRAEALGAEPQGLISQTDTFFPAPYGRLKLRDFGDGSGELIGYRRPDEAVARVSEYEIARTMELPALCGVLSLALGASLVVRKERELWIYRSTRIHLDQVEQLGSFVELETVVSTQTLAAAREELEAVAGALELDETQREARAYIDLLTDLRDTRN